MHRLEDLLNPEYIRQAAQDDLGIVLGDDGVEEHPREIVPAANGDEDLEGGNVENPEVVVEEPEEEEEDLEIIEEYEEEEEEDVVLVDSDDGENMHMVASDDDG